MEDPLQDEDSWCEEPNRGRVFSSRPCISSQDISSLEGLGESEAPGTSSPRSSRQQQMGFHQHKKEDPFIAIAGGVFGNKKNNNTSRVLVEEILVPLSESTRKTNSLTDPTRTANIRTAPEAPAKHQKEIIADDQLSDLDPSGLSELQDLSLRLLRGRCGTQSESDDEDGSVAAASSIFMTSESSDEDASLLSENDDQCCTCTSHQTLGSMSEEMAAGKEEGAYDRPMTTTTSSPRRSSSYYDRTSYADDDERSGWQVSIPMGAGPERRLDTDGVSTLAESSLHYSSAGDDAADEEVVVALGGRRIVACSSSKKQEQHLGEGKKAAVGAAPSKKEESSTASEEEETVYPQSSSKSSRSTTESFHSYNSSSKISTKRRAKPYPRSHERNSTPRQDGELPRQHYNRKRQQRALESLDSEKKKSSPMSPTYLLSSSTRRRVDIIFTSENNNTNNQGGRARPQALAEENNEMAAVANQLISGARIARSMARLKKLMIKSTKSQAALQLEDKKQGLPKSHSQTMVNTSRSRLQLQKGIILPKWDGTPLINDETELGKPRARRKNHPAMDEQHRHNHHKRSPKRQRQSCIVSRKKQCSPDESPEQKKKAP